MIKKLFLILLLGNSLPAFTQIHDSPDSVALHTEDIALFWKAFDETSPKFNGKMLQKNYIEAGSPGLKGFVKMRIENGSNLSKVIKDNLEYYQTVREGTLSIEGRTQKLREYFYGLKKLYSFAVFPDVYFVVGAKNSGGTTFSGGLIIGAEMFGTETETFKPEVNIDALELVVVHELIHYQQHYVNNNTLLAQSIREGAADFICEQVTGSHSNMRIHEYGNAHAAELWKEFSQQMYDTVWTPWLYHSKDKSRPNDLGYWVGYKIVKAYYEKSDDKVRAVYDILNINDFTKFWEKSGYTGQ